MHLSLYVEKLRALAQTGHNHSSDLPYHRAIYQQMLGTCRDLLSDRVEHEPEEQWKSFAPEMGVITPKVGAVVAVIRQSKEVLVLQRPTGRWCLPCGYADIGETPEATGLREVREETGLDVKLNYFLGLATTLDDPSLPFMWEAIYLAEIKSGILKLSHEHQGADWVSELDDRLWHSTHCKHVQRALNFLKNPPIGSTAISIGPTP